MNLGKFLSINTDSYQECVKLGVKEATINKHFIDGLKVSFPLIPDSTNSKFTIELIKIPMTAESLEYTYGCKIILHDDLMKTFIDIYPEKLI